MNQKNNAHHRRFFVKGLIILLLLGMNYLMFSFFFSSVVEDITYDNESRRDTRLLELTSEGEYADLYEELNLYDLYEDKYDDYWDVTDAWHLYCRFRAAEEAGSSAEAEVLRSRLLELPADQENRTAQTAVGRIQKLVREGA
ncbi:hypothetical protein B5F29_04330 [Lachnoclostridium sp. An196]|uniref:hypothetical protein n=1 Tax=Lachnoclostridium sp. An196 TaxID=1965583 RepID=UPI000B38055C|nr:hypothetical protein [Lachnoclostridium sp. An196]OUP21703.1 hypothetical protein B5F29_04330 [Lachnoclostridium sp. An196]